MKTYLINSVKGSYWTGDYDLDPLMYDMGTTYSDYLEGKIIELSDEQLQFHIDNPKASVREVIIMTLDPEPAGPTEEELLEMAKNKKRSDITEYAYSDNVKNYSLDENSFWMDRQKRLFVKNDLDISKQNGSLMFDLTDNLTVEIGVADMALGNMNEYDAACEVITISKMNEVASASTIEEVEAIDAESGYPTVLKDTSYDLREKNNIVESNNPQVAAARFLMATINTPDTLAATPANLVLKVQSLYPIWDKDGIYGDQGLKMGTAVVKGQRFRYKNKPEDLEFSLFEVRSNHNLQSDWVPGEEGGAESLYFIVQETHEGTIDDPIPWKYNMILENGKYYIDKDIKYICVRDSVNPMPYEDLAELVAGGYVNVA